MGLSPCSSAIFSAVLGMALMSSTERTAAMRVSYQRPISLPLTLAQARARASVMRAATSASSRLRPNASSIMSAKRAP